MMEQHQQLIRHTDLAAQPHIYEIRVKGRLEGEIWSEWFEGMTVMVEESGETILQGPLTDQSALYGLLSRLRDLAVPLLSVNIMGMEPPQVILPPNKRAPRRINWLMILLYLLLIGALASLTVFLTSEAILPTSLALGTLFLLLGSIAFIFSRYENAWWWRLLTVLNWLGAVPGLIIYLIEAGLSTALAMAILLFMAAGGLVYLISLQKKGVTRVKTIRWEKLGHRSEQPASGDRNPDRLR
ncbi:MAG: hypothetical protein JXB07_11155 [Anaerolineae bacterium]|nr:hypothetical protein [Anaerolineae bacterium]